RGIARGRWSRARKLGQPFPVGISRSFDAQLLVQRSATGLQNHWYENQACRRRVAILGSGPSHGHRPHRGDRQRGGAFPSPLILPEDARIFFWKTEAVPKKIVPA